MGLSPSRIDINLGHFLLHFLLNNLTPISLNLRLPRTLAIVLIIINRHIFAEEVHHLDLSLFIDVIGQLIINFMIKFNKNCGLQYWNHNLSRFFSIWIPEFPSSYKICLT